MQFLEHLLKNLVVRDLIFLFGGSTFLYSLLDKTRIFRINLNTVSGIEIFLFLGFAYVVGYVIQEATTILRITTTKVPIKYCWLVRIIHNCIHREKGLPDFVDNELKSAKKFINFEKDNEHLRLERERIILFKNIGMTLGPTMIYTSFIYFYSTYFLGGNQCDLAISLLVFGIILILLGWVKTVRLAFFLNDVWDSMTADEQEKYKSINSKLDLPVR